MADQPNTARNCSFNKNPEFPCPAQNAPYYALRETCMPGEYGKKCGSYVVQSLVGETLDLEDLSSTLDEDYGLITGSALVVKTPKGDINEATRRAIVGTRFPLREKRPTDKKTVAVLHTDLVLTLAQKGRMTHAMPYEAYRLKAALAGAVVDWWQFRRKELAVSVAPTPITTINMYDDSFDIHRPAAYMA